MERATPDSQPLVYAMMNLQPDGEKIGPTTTQTILKAMSDAGNYWLSVKDLVLTPDGDTFADCVRAAAPAYEDGTTPLAAHMEAAIYHAALKST